jgi:hypothetical protein
MPDQSCGSCHYWRGEGLYGFRMCHWTAAALPFWAAVDPDFDDHTGGTRSTDGKRCRTWAEREEAAGG